MSNTDRNANLFVPINEVYPENLNDFQRKVREVYNKTALWLNQREIGIYIDDREVPDGQTWYGSSPQVKRQNYRKVFSFGAITAGNTLTQAHGITGGTITYTHIYGAFTTNVVDQRPLPSAVVNVRVDGTNFYIDNASANNITSGNLVLEYLKV